MHIHDQFCRCRACKPGFAPLASNDARPAAVDRISFAAAGLCVCLFLTIGFGVAQAAL